MRALKLTALTAAALIAATGTATAQPTTDAQPYTFAVIGDLPYGQDQLAKLPGWVADINADQDVETVIHLGDTKSGGDVCSDEWNTAVLNQFNSFEDPLVYTPGDNEWTDCHRVSNGSYNPLERLAAIKREYFPKPGQTLGQNPMRVDWHPFQHENVSWHKDDVTFATLHIVGSNNGARAWSGLGETKEVPAQKWERRLRTFHTIEWLNQVFRKATQNNDRAVVLNTQADMFYKNSPSDKYNSEFKTLVRHIAAESKAFGKPVYLFNGDTHEYLVDKPLTGDSNFLAYYGVEEVPNLTRVQVDGSKNATNWVKVTVQPQGTGDVLTWTQVPFSDQ